MSTSSTASRAKKPLQLSGLYPATVTPFSEDFSIDQPSLRRHLQQVADTEGVRGIVVNGGIGELLQLSLAEQIQVVEEARKAVTGEQIVVAGLYASNARQAAEQARALKQAGAQALLVLPPFDIRAYRRLLKHEPSVTRYFSELGDAGGLPMIIFQYAPNSGAAYPLEILAALAEIPQVIAIKATSASLEAYQPIWNLLQDRLSILAAVDGPPLVEMLEYGAHGALIGISTIGTPFWVDLVQAAREQDRERVAQVFRDHCAPIMEKVWENHLPTRFVSEIASTKEALVQMGHLPSARVRPPSVGMTEEVRKEIQTGLMQAGLLGHTAAA